MSDNWRPNQDKLQRLSRAQQSMAPGTLGGRIAQATPATRRRPTDPGGGDSVQAVFSTASSPVVGEESPPYFNHTALATVGTILLSTRSVTTGASTCEVMVGGTVVATLTWPAGERVAELTPDADISLEYGDLLTVRFPVVGAGLDGATVQILLVD